MSTTTRVITTTKPKRETWCFQPPTDVKTLVTRALKELGVDPDKGDKCNGLRTLILVKAIRVGLARHARKKELELLSKEAA